MITASQLRAARALLNWSQQSLATSSGVAERTIRSIEDGQARAYEATLDRLQAVMEREGVVFLESDAGVGVLLAVAQPR